MVAAMDAVSSGEMTITSSSRAFSVPRKTWDDRVKGHVTHGKKPGINTVLSAEEVIFGSVPFVYGPARFSSN